MKANKYKLKPTLDQIEKLSQNFGCARFIYNFALSKKSELWKSEQKSISRFELQALLAKMKKEEATIWLKQAHSQVLQSSLMHLDNSFKNFFKKRSKYPRYKKKSGKQSIQYPQSVKIEGNKIYLPKIGWIKAVVHREIQGKIKTVTVSKDATGTYFASVLVDDGLEKPKTMKNIKSHVGLDAGIKDFITISDGKKIKNKKFLDKKLKNLKRKQRKLSRKAKGSARRSKARNLLAKVHKKVKNARDDFHHKVSLKLAVENQAVSIEDLSISKMVQTKYLARYLSDIGWNSFVEKLKYKLEDRGSTLIKIGKFFPSTKTCSKCGFVQSGITLSKRSWVCDNCETEHDRDLNASINIDNQGVIKLKAEGFTVSARGGLRKTA